MVNSNVQGQIIVKGIKLTILLLVVISILGVFVTPTRRLKKSHLIFQP